MKDDNFYKYLISETKRLHPDYLDDDPLVRLNGMDLYVSDSIGGMGTIHHPLPRKLRALATQLLMCADELERRSFDTVLVYKEWSGQ